MTEIDKNIPPELIGEAARFAIQQAESRRKRDAEIYANPMGQMMDGFIKNAEAARQVETGHDRDYIGDDGMLCCGDCHKPRQMVIDVPLIGQRTVPIMCDCDKARVEREEAEKRAKEEMERVEQLRRIGVTNRAYLDLTFAADRGFNPEMTAIAHRYVENRKAVQEENTGLLLHGTPGGGKTFWAAAIGNALIEKGCSVLIAKASTLADAMMRDYGRDKEEILARVASVRFLVLDDVGAERQTSTAIANLEDIIDARSLAKRPLIVTTNFTLDEITNPTNLEYQRIFQRMTEMCQPIHLNGEGRRLALAREKGIKAREILGL